MSKCKVPFELEAQTKWSSWPHLKSALGERPNVSFDTSWSCHWHLSPSCGDSAWSPQSSWQPARFLSTSISASLQPHLFPQFISGRSTRKYEHDSNSLCLSLFSEKWWHTDTLYLFSLFRIFTSFFCFFYRFYKLLTSMPASLIHCSYILVAHHCFHNSYQYHHWLIIGPCIMKGKICTL